jgi:ABC-type Fe3+/spermidine/putrescine transport system ATPase subunit
MSLTVVNLSKRSKDKWVLRDVSFDVVQGEIFGIFGPVGSGKTTITEAVLGRIETNGGTIRVNDRDAATDGRSFSSADPTPRSFLSRFFSDGRSPNATERLAALNRAIDEARNVLVLNEPFAGIDAASRKASIERLRSAAADRKLIVVLASSNFRDMLTACDRVAVLAKGEIQQIGTPQEVYEMPVSRTVAALTGRNNLFVARRLTSSKAEVPEFHTIDGGHRLFAQRIERGSLGALNQNVTLGIRPEQVSLSFGASFPADNLLKATVTGIKFMGPTTIIELDADGLHLEALVLRLVGLNIGDECMVGLPPDRIQIFKD